MKLSIVMPSYNAGPYIKRAIDSVLAQPYADKELIVIDGGSTDHTVDILKTYGSRIAWVSEKDRGQSDAINKGFKKATGDIVAWLNADDFYEPDVFGDVVAAFEKNPAAGLVFGNCRMVSATSSHVAVPDRQPTVGKLINNGNTLYGPSCFFRRATVLEAGLLDETLHFWMDYDLFIRLLMRSESAYLDKTLSNFIVRDGQKSDMKNLLAMDKELLRAAKGYGGAGFFSRMRLASWYHRATSWLHHS